MQAVADAAEKRKLVDLANKVASLSNNSQSGDSRLVWEFAPLAFDSLGALSTTGCKVVEEEHVKRVALRSGCSYDQVKQRTSPHLSYAIWASKAAAILCRAPQYAEDK